MTIIQAVEDPKLFGPLFKDLGTWRAWPIFLRALFGLGIEGEDLKIFSECAGLREAPGEAARECFVISGRRSGKSFMSSLIALFLAEPTLPSLAPFLLPLTRRLDWREIVQPGGL